MAGEVGGGRRRGQVRRIESLGRPATPEDVWNAAVRSGADPARMALSLCHVLGEGAATADDEDDAVPVRYTLAGGEVVCYDATFHNPFHRLPGERGA